MKKIFSKTKTKLWVCGLSFGLSMLLSAQVLAQSSSTNYRLEESYFGIGGELEATSPNYRAQQSGGETGVGNINGNNYQANAGFNTKEEPYLEVSVTGGNTDLGDLSPSSTSTTTSTFYVRAYLASGYSVVIASDPPTYGSEQIDPISTPSAPTTGTEQFGINLRANTNPTTFGADPSHSPDGSFSFGYAAPGYNTANLYKYDKGDVIAQSDSSSGRTDYTISYIYNIGPLSPAGTYIFVQDLVVIGTY